MDTSVLFPGARLPPDSDVTIFDGTYWGREDFSRERVTSQLEDVIRNNGPVIIPSFAVGRSQEVLMMLEHIGITKRRNVIVAGMAEQVTKVCGYSGGWSAIKKNKASLDKEDILVSGGGMMGGGLAREHFEEHRNNPQAAVVLCGYLARRTPGWNLLWGHEKHACRVEYARLSAHTSSTKLQGWVASCSGKKVMVHTPVGEPPIGITIPAHSTRIILET
jgi:putative mRNA 3-end processing factor